MSEINRCDLCGLTFSTRGSLKRHLEVKHETDNMRCDICLKELEDRHLEDHVLTQHGKSFFEVCDKCGKQFFHPKSFKIHVAVFHEKTRIPKTYKCKTCGKTFINPKSAEAHCLQDNTDTKCDFCEMTFLSMANKNRHQKQKHANDTKYKCDYCEAHFPFKSNLNKHVRLVHEENHKECDVCGKAFCKVSNLRRHIAAAHSSMAAKSKSQSP